MVSTFKAVVASNTRLKEDHAEAKKRDASNEMYHDSTLPWL